VKIGDTVRVEVLVKDTRVTRDPRKGVQVWEYSVLNQRDERVLVFDYQLMFHLRG
jgi:acyl dehydratase